ncbi:gamma-glutamylcyclotransferase family protein [Aporhodopirellula aestuarii]|uniref:Gamma-glutamylcyclotransferase n=1 Tax=Aporhodopirellula aestuarii TaxID=2950107 RepID=A0ABT0U3X2_9BACT|nr:gamma-glutamylcyclotransferase family protein [Aporhodopirellula aestuarii]MCM2371245.1 gamma-glutamylcyclotransferase [Aporhodopirellula aestuarii]
MHAFAQTEPIDSFFVYGTLCRGQCREKCWPFPPIEVTPGWVHGTLFDRADYPAMTPGEDRVTGELWRFAREVMDQVLQVIDEVEGTDQPGCPNLYDRVTCDVFTIESVARENVVEADCLTRAWGYHYSTPPELDGFVRIRPTPLLTVSWPPK